MRQKKGLYLGNTAQVVRAVLADPFARKRRPNALNSAAIPVLLSFFRTKIFRDSGDTPFVRYCLWLRTEGWTIHVEKGIVRRVRAGLEAAAPGRNACARGGVPFLFNARIM